MVEMIKQREQLALETSFARTVSRLTDAKTLMLYRLKKANHETSAVPILRFVASELVTLQPSQIKPFSLSSNPAIAERLSKTNVADMFKSAAEHNHELILPLRGANTEISVFCRIENASDDPNTHRVLTQLLEFYQHFLSLLDDNERDNLTGLLNRKSLPAQLAKIQRTLNNRHRRNADTMAGNYYLAITDIDHFKHINDTYGHIYGDEALLQFANLMRESFREYDQLFRYGGEEFIILLHNAGAKQAQAALDRFRNKVSCHPFTHTGQIQTSVGFTVIQGHDLPEEAIGRADLALYYAKEHGRNQVRSHEELLSQGLLTV